MPFALHSIYRWLSRHLAFRLRWRRNPVAQAPVLGFANYETSLRPPRKLQASRRSAARSTIGYSSLESSVQKREAPPTIQPVLPNRVGDNLRKTRAPLGLLREMQMDQRNYAFPQA